MEGEEKASGVLFFLLSWMDFLPFFMWQIGVCLPRPNTRREIVQNKPHIKTKSWKFFFPFLIPGIRELRNSRERFYYCTTLSPFFCPVIQPAAASENRAFLHTFISLKKSGNSEQVRIFTMWIWNLIGIATATETARQSHQHEMDIDAQWQKNGEGTTHRDFPNWALQK